MPLPLWLLVEATPCGPDLQRATAAQSLWCSFSWLAGLRRASNPRSFGSSKLAQDPASGKLSYTRVQSGDSGQTSRRPRFPSGFYLPDTSTWRGAARGRGVLSELCQAELRIGTSCWLDVLCSALGCPLTAFGAASSPSRPRHPSCTASRAGCRRAEPDRDCVFCRFGSGGPVSRHFGRPARGHGAGAGRPRDGRAHHH